MIINRLAIIVGIFMMIFCFYNYRNAWSLSLCIVGSNLFITGLLNEIK